MLKVQAHPAAQVQPLQTNLSVGCYCENEHRCHRAILKALLAEREATIECVCVRHSTPPTCLFTEIGGDKGSTAGSQKRIFTEDEFMTAGTIYRFSAFSSHPEGGNPAGVWIGGHAS